MQKYYYDFHIHTALSPCADDDMTPQNIVGMAKLIGLDVIAITDHNTVANCEAVMQASEELGGAIVLAGMELETEESIHVLMLFDNLAAAKACEKIIKTDCLKIKNRPDIYGRQIYFDSGDNIVGEEENLLLVSTSLSLDESRKLAADLGGVAVPAHIDKPSNALIAVLGAITPDMGFHTVELSRRASEQLKWKLESESYFLLHDSDSHRLDSINEKNENFLELETLNASGVISALRNIKSDKKQ